MNIESYLKENILLIVPNNLKNSLLEEIDKLNTLPRLKIMSLDEVIKHLYFDITELTIYKLMTKYSIKYDVSKVYLENMYYLDEKEYSEKKLNDLLEKYHYLKENNLLIIDPLFSKLLSNKKIVLYGYNYFTKFEEKTIKKLEELTQVTIIKEQELSKKKIQVYEFLNIEEEVEFVINKIIKLLNNNIDINNIKLIGVDDTYYNTIEKLFTFYNIPFEKKKTAIYQTKIGNSFLKYVEESLSFEKIIETLKTKYSKNEEVEIINQIITIVNKYTWYNGNVCNLLELLKDDLKKTYVKTKTIKSKVTFSDLNPYNFKKDDYVFLLGFNHGIYPTIIKDEDFISDNLKDEVNLDTTIDKNKMNYQKVINAIYRINNLTISYKLKTPYETFYPSIIIENEQFEIVNKQNIDIQTSYSSLNNKLKLAKYLDNYLKYGTYDEKINLLYENYKDINYLTYDNSYTKIKKEKIRKYLNNKLLLSYSSIDSFYRCQFRYYLTNILKLNKYEETFKIVIGNIFHLILSNCFEENFNFDIIWENEIKKHEFNSEEKFFLTKLKEELKLIIETVKQQHNITGLTNVLLEEKVYINKDFEIPTTFMGVIDKLMFKEKDNLTYAAIIDYKTGNVPIDLANTYYGISMQLPIYVYLVKNMAKLSNVFVVGFYFQKILHDEIKRDLKKSYLEQKKDLLRLNGYSTNNIKALSYFDPDYEDSKMIKSMKTTNQGFYHYSKVISEEEVDNLCKFIDEKINNAANKIINADFTINPKRIDGNPVGCDFCPYNYICYKKEDDYINYNKKKDLNFLGGDNLGMD